MRRGAKAPHRRPASAVRAPRSVLPVLQGFLAKVPSPNCPCLIPIFLSEPAAQAGARLKLSRFTPSSRPSYPMAQCSAEIGSCRPLADPRKVRFQAVEAEANDRVGWISAGPLSSSKRSKQALRGRSKRALPRVRLSPTEHTDLESLEPALTLCRLMRLLVPDGSSSEDQKGTR